MGGEGRKKTDEGSHEGWIGVLSRKSGLEKRMAGVYFEISERGKSLQPSH